MRTDSQILFARYRRNASEVAFGELVTRYIDLVYSTAFRLVNADKHRAEDVAQLVFIDLARMARKLPSNVMLGGWLHRHTVFVASNVMRSERRRQHREREAAEMNALEDHSFTDLSQLLPILDEAIDQLGTEERNAILLRFFEQLDFRSVGEALGSSEEAARKRVNRALEKLHVLLRKRGIAISTVALGTALLGQAVSAAPVGIAAGITLSALANVPAPAGFTATLLNLTSMTKIHAAILGTLVFAGVATYLVFQHQAQLTLSEENNSLRQQITKLQSENETFSNRVAQITRSSYSGTDRLRELLRLRAEVGALRRRQRELELAAAQSKPTGAPGTVSSGETPQLNNPAPFQVQIVVDSPSEDSEAITNNSMAGKVETLYVQKTPLLDSTAISSATVTKNTDGVPQIDVEFSDVGRELFAQVTKENLNKRLAIVVDGRLLLAPVIRSEIPGGRVELTGSFTEQEARDLAAKINDVVSTSRN